MGKAAKKHDPSAGELIVHTEPVQPKHLVIVAKEINDALIEQQLGDVLGTLDIRRAALVRECFGLGGNGTPKTHAEVADRKGTSVETVDDELAKALRALMGYAKKKI